MKTSEKVDIILPALGKVKYNLQPVVKGTRNPFFKSNYADLNAHLETVEPLLLENGLVLFQPVIENSTYNLVTSRIYHVGSGQFVESSMKLMGETDMQKAGSAVTYARRYTLSSLLGMTSADDDGNAAVGKAPKVAATKEPEQKATEAAQTSPAPKDKPSFRRPKAQANSAPKVEEPKVVSNGDDL